MYIPCKTTSDSFHSKYGIIQTKIGNLAVLGTTLELLPNCPYIFGQSLSELIILSIKHLVHRWYTALVYSPLTM